MAYYKNGLNFGRIKKKKEKKEDKQEIHTLCQENAAGHSTHLAAFPRSRGVTHGELPHLNRSMIHVRSVMGTSY